MKHVCQASSSDKSNPSLENTTGTVNVRAANTVDGSCSTSPTIQTLTFLEILDEFI